jgi:ribulose kinase
MLSLWGNYMNIDIKMAPKDKKNIRGLCGNFDGDVTNDLAHSDGKQSFLTTGTYYYSRKHEEFINSWRFVV